MQYSEIEVHLLGKSTCDPSKHIMDNPILIVAFSMGKSIFPESRGKTLSKQDSHICKKIPLIFFDLDLVVQ